MAAVPHLRRLGRKPELLSVRFARPGETPETLRVLRCLRCTSPFDAVRQPPDYASEAFSARGQAAFYLQQGAGPGLLTRPLAQLRRPPGSRYLEVGCGFGFALDFAVQARGFVGMGIDPGRLAAQGRQAFGLDIALRPLGTDEPALAGQFDVVMAAETIEHVASPAAFVRTLRRALRPGGVLVLTTPTAICSTRQPRRVGWSGCCRRASTWCSRPRPACAGCCAAPASPPSPCSASATRWWPTPLSATNRSTATRWGCGPPTAAGSKAAPARSIPAATSASGSTDGRCGRR